MNRDLEFRRLYAKVPRIECKGLCFGACGPIGMTPHESRKLNRAAGHEVHANDDLTCSALTEDGRCSAYNDRPLICRLWGVTERMPCEHGCEIIDNDGKPLTIAESTVIVNRSVALSPGPPVWTLPEDEVEFISKLVRSIG